MKTKWNEFVVEEKLNGCKNTQFKYKEIRSYYVTFYIDPVWLCVYKASSLLFLEEARNARSDTTSAQSYQNSVS